jgi:hypothetical protein
MYNTNELDQVLSALKYIKLEEPTSEITGLCYNVFEYIDKNYKETKISYGDSQSIMQNHFLSWSKFSGNYDYPVEGDEETYYNVLNKYDRRTLYGKLRYQLIDHLVERITDEIYEDQAERV